MSALRLHPDDIEAIARRVVALQAEEAAPAAELLTAAQAAARLGVTAAWVRAHGAELGVVRLGDGAKPRLRFPVDGVAAVLRSRSAGDGSRPGGSPAVVRARELSAAAVSARGLECLPEQWREAVEGGGDSSFTRHDPPPPGGANGNPLAL